MLFARMRHMIITIKDSWIKKQLLEEHYNYIKKDKQITRPLCYKDINTVNFDPQCIY